MIAIGSFVECQPAEAGALRFGEICRMNFVASGCFAQAGISGAWARLRPPGGDQTPTTKHPLPWFGRS